MFEYNKKEDSIVVKIEIPLPPDDELNGIVLTKLTKSRKIDWIFQKTKEELEQAWQRALIDTDALDKELADKAAEIARRKVSKLEINI